MSQEEDTGRLALSIVDFLRNELTDPDLSLEDTDNIQIAIEGLQSAYNLNEISNIQRRSLLDMFMQVSNPVSVKDRQRAESLKDDGNTKMENGQYQEAEQEYSQAIELDRFNAIFYCNRAGARIKLQHYYEATADCRQALILNPDYSKAYGRMGQAYALMDSHRRAARCFRHALELEPDNGTYRNNLSVAEQRVADDPASLIGLLMQGLLSSVLGGGGGGGGTGSGAGEMPGPSFVIVSEPHTAEECESGHGPGETNRDGNESDTVLQDGQTSDSDDSEGGSSDSEEEFLHLRVLFGIPFTQEEDKTDQVSGDVNPMQQTDTADTNSAPKEQEETLNDSGTLNETPVNENPPELSEPQRLETNEVSDSSENADSIGAVVKSDDNASKKTSDGSMDKSMLRESKEQSQSQGLESKDTVKNKQDRSPGFNLSDISSFFKNFGRSSTTTEVGKSNGTSQSNKDGNKGTEEAAKASVNKEINKKTDDKPKGNQEK